MSNSLAHKAKRQLRAKRKAKLNNIKRPKRLTVEARRLERIRG